MAAADVGTRFWRQHHRAPQREWTPWQEHHPTWPLGPRQREDAQATASARPAAQRRFLDRCVFFRRRCRSCIDSL
jgi:hypothetical protein